MAQITEMLGTDARIQDLTGIHCLVSLEILYLGSNNISDLTPLASLTNLTTLYVSDSGNDRAISDYSPLSNLVNLTTLTLVGYPEADIAPLASPSGGADLRRRLTSRPTDMSITTSLSTCRTGRLWLITPQSAVTTDQPEAHATAAQLRLWGQRGRGIQNIPSRTISVIMLGPPPAAHSGTVRAFDFTSATLCVQICGSSSRAGIRWMSSRRVGRSFW